MIGTASSLQGQDSGGTVACARLPSQLLARRASERRHMLFVQTASGTLLTLVLLTYCCADTISIALPSAYFLSGITLMGFFAVLSETHVNDRSEDQKYPNAPG